MYVYVFYIFFVFVKVHSKSYKKIISELNLINIHCRDNHDAPVDWWYIYKPPESIGPYFESGSNFTFITSRTSGRWQPSRRSINSNSMIQFTLAPLYMKISRDYLAVMSYGEPPEEIDRGYLLRSKTSPAFGIMFANSMGGVWIGHSVPGFPNLNNEMASFPIDEYPYGHMLMCLSLDLDSLNQLASVVKYSETNIVELTVPKSLSHVLKNWSFKATPRELRGEKGPEPNTWSFVTRDKTLRGIMLARTPDDKSSLYEAFAKMHGIVLDIYSNTVKDPCVSGDVYSVRYIDTISLKFPEQKVYYIDNSTDKMRFAVSTAAAWQKQGLAKDQYWTCIGTSEVPPEGIDKGGMIACFYHYNIWLTFDNLKVKEPECNENIF